jgi:3'-phosphoadenosine 5'-phosphosulfate (PAPS) 3'-phosphatase
MFEKEQNFACRLAQEVGDWIESVRNTELMCRTKPDNSVVTEADLEADLRICRAIKEAFPGDGVLSEEGGFGGVENASRRWMVDPIDGTSAFVSHQPGYRVQIGLMEEGIPRVGVLYDPLERQLISAAHGQGTTLMDMNTGETRALQVSSRGQGDEIRLTLSMRLSASDRASLCQDTGWKPGPVIYGTGSKISLVAQGEAEVYFSGHPLSYWDTLAPLVIVQEAGGRASLLSGKPLDFLGGKETVHSDLVVITHGAHHEEVLSVLRRCYGARTESP